MRELICVHLLCVSVCVCISDVIMSIHLSSSVALVSRLLKEERTLILHNHFTACVKLCSPFICTAVKHSPCHTPSYSGPQIYQLTQHFASITVAFCTARPAYRVTMRAECTQHDIKWTVSIKWLAIMFWCDLREWMTLDFIIYVQGCWTRLHQINSGHFRPIF